MEVFVTGHYGGAYYAQRKSSSAGSVHAVGESGFTHVAGGDFDEHGRDKGNLCIYGVGSERGIGAERPHVWRTAYRVLPSEPGQLAIEVEWSYVYSREEGRGERLAGDTRTIHLREGERHVLHHVDIEPSPDDYCNRNVSIAIGAAIVEDPQFSDALLEYDVWLRHTDEAGEVHRRQFRAVGGQGEQISYRMLPLSFRALDSFFADGAGIDSILEIGGSVRGRLQEDGTIELQLDATRWIDARREGLPRDGGVGDGGKKVFSVAAGETVGMLLPTPRGSNCVGHDDGGSAAIAGRSADATQDAHCVDNAVFYRDHQDEIILTVRRDGSSPIQVATTR